MCVYVCLCVHESARVPDGCLEGLCPERGSPQHGGCGQAEDTCHFPPELSGLERGQFLEDGAVLFPSPEWPWAREEGVRSRTSAAGLEGLRVCICNSFLARLSC